MALRLAIHCPYCKRPVPSSPLQLGRTIACPHCRGEFVASPSAMTEERAPSQEAPPNRLPATPLQQAPAPRPSAHLASPGAPPNGHHYSAALPVAQPLGATTPAAGVPAATAKPKTAQFVADKAQASTIAPGADGSLPKLQLADAPAEAAAQPESRPLPLWVALLLMMVSTALSSLLLLSDTGTTKQETSKAEARRELERFYGLGDGPLLPYQVHLREARLARSRGDYASERNRYRYVLSLLRAEGRGAYVGLAGTPRDDEELERLLTILLAND